MLDLFENGNYKRRRRRRNMKKCQKDRKHSFSKTLLSGEFTHLGSSECLSSDHEQRPEPRSREVNSNVLFSSTISGRQTPSSSLRKTDEIKFSIDYILSAPDPLPVLRHQYQLFDNRYILDSQQQSLHFWSL